MTLDEALEHVEIGQSISQTIWTEHPESIDIEPEPGMEYQVKMTVTKRADNSHVITGKLLATRRIDNITT